MRFRTNPRRWKRGFALLPLSLVDGTVIWLEGYWYRSGGDCIEVETGKEYPAHD